MATVGACCTFFFGFFGENDEWRGTDLLVGDRRWKPEIDVFTHVGFEFLFDGKRGVRNT